MIKNIILKLMRQAMGCKVRWTKEERALIHSYTNKNKCLRF